MQKLNKYISPLIYDMGHNGNPTDASVGRTNAFIEGLTNLPLEKEVVAFKPYYMPVEKGFIGHEYYILLNNISDMLKVRMMWRWLLREEDGRAVKGIWIIGSPDRIYLAHKYITWFFGAYWDYHRFLCSTAQEESKRANYSNVRSYASKQVAIYMNTINNAIHSKLEEDKKYGLWLDNMINELFRLDWKAYEGKHEYYHALSNKFHHRRMIS